uniref:Uncharacterized protein n=1 Tax=Gouania willdenowi TaxID=441366 RepID=A0A8C5GBT9_GOUWI
MSDTQGTVCGSKPSSELQELVSRVASLEAQDERRMDIIHFKLYNSLIQAQARELSHLRQRMREGQGVIHILSQHLGDTTKAFEELLRANDIDYYMGQSFREQLAHSSALVHRVGTKISSGNITPPDHLHLFSSNEITPAPQRVETPSSCHALSETTEPSDRTSLASDEYQTNEDLDMCSDLDAGDFQHQEPEADGVNLMEEHLQEVRYLRQRLDESIRTNERLRQQLEEKLATVGREGGKYQTWVTWLGSVQAPKGNTQNNSNNSKQQQKYTNFL